MSIIRSTNTINIRPSFVDTVNLLPSSVSTIQYAGYIDENNTKRYGTFKYGARSYGTTTEYSAGQKMPQISTEVL